MLSEIVTGLSAANQATALLKELRSIDSSVDEAAYKLKLAELTEALADTKIALSQAKLAISEQETEIASLRQQLTEASSPERCPRCRNGRLDVTHVEQHEMVLAARNGVQRWTLHCDNPECVHEDVRLHDPNGITSAGRVKQF